MKEYGRPLGIQHPRRFLHDPDEDRREVDLGADLGNQFEERRLLDPAALDLLDILVALEGDGRLARHVGEEIQVVRRELAAPLVEALDDADRLSGERPDGHTDHALGAVACPLVDARIETLVRIGIGRRDRLAGLEGMTGKAGVVEDTDLVREVAERHPRIEFRRRRIVEEQRAAIAVEFPRRDLDQLLEQTVEGLLESASAGYVEEDAGTPERALFGVRQPAVGPRRCHGNRLGHDAASSFPRRSLI